MITINETHIKNVAKQIGILCTENKCDLKHTAILDAIAKGIGYKSYNALKPKFTSTNLNKINDSKIENLTMEFNCTDNAIDYDTSELSSLNKRFFTRCTSLVAGMTSGIKIVQIEEILYWLFDDLRTGLNRLKLSGKQDWYGRQIKSVDELKILIFKYFLSDVLLAADHWNISKDLKGYSYDEFYEIEANDEYLYSLIQNNLLYDKQLLELLNISEKDFLRSVEHARGEDRNSVVYDYRDYEI